MLFKLIGYSLVIVCILFALLLCAIAALEIFAIATDQPVYWIDHSRLITIVPILVALITAPILMIVARMSYPDGDIPEEA